MGSTGCRLGNDRTAAASVEYVLVAMLVAVALIVGLNAMGNSVSSTASTAGTALADHEHDASIDGNMGFGTTLGSVDLGQAPNVPPDNGGSIWSGGGGRPSHEGKNSTISDPSPNRINANSSLDGLSSQRRKGFVIRRDSGTARDRVNADDEFAKTEVGENQPLTTTP